MIQSLVRQFLFFSGTTKQSYNYLARPEVTALWAVLLPGDGKVQAGLSATAKKDGWWIRKLLMRVVRSFLMVGLRTLPCPIMHGGEIFPRIHIPSDETFVSTCDEGNAFSNLILPE